MRSSPPRRSIGRRNKLHIQLLDDSTDETSALRKRRRNNCARRASTFCMCAVRIATALRRARWRTGSTKSDAPVIAVLDIDFRAAARLAAHRGALSSRRSEGRFPAIALRILQLPDELADARPGPDARRALRDGAGDALSRRLAVPVQRHGRSLAARGDRGGRRLDRAIPYAKISIWWFVRNLPVGMAYF